MRPRADLDDFDSLFNQDEAQERRRARAEMIAAGQERTRVETERDAAAALRTKEWARRSTDEFLIREYRAAGVEPPSVDASGVPLCGLQLLLSIGWRIESADGQRRLVAPPPEPKSSKRDYR